MSERVTYMNEDQKSKEIMEIYRKAENISSAVFLVSDTMSDAGELKTKIKDLALRLIADCSLIKNVPVGEKVKNIHSLEAIALNLSSLFQVSSVSGMVSPMNSSVVRSEIQAFIALLVSYTKSIHDLAISLVKESAVVSEPNLAMPSQPVASAEATTVKKQSGQANGQTKVTRKDTRERTILEFIKTKDSVNIKDIARNVRGCSEKTIQRELLKMVDSGLVKKTGERRWSRYSYIGSQL
jgi:hypothetical protein